MAMAPSPLLTAVVAATATRHFLLLATPMPGVVSRGDGHRHVRETTCRNERQRQNATRRDAYHAKHQIAVPPLPQLHCPPLPPTTKRRARGGLSDAATTAVAIVLAIAAAATATTAPAPSATATTTAATASGAVGEERARDSRSSGGKWGCMRLG